MGGWGLGGEKRKGTAGGEGRDGRKEEGGRMRDGMAE
jgi:hypothetical protein